MRITVHIDFEEVHRNHMADWINRLKQQEETARRDLEQRQARQMRQQELVASKGPSSWEKVIAQVERDISDLRAAFPDDKSKDIHFERCDGGLILERHEYPQVLLRSRWLPEIGGVGIEISSKRFAGATTSGPLKMEIAFSLTAENDIRMVFEGQPYIVPETLSQPLIMRVLNER